MATSQQRESRKIEYWAVDTINIPNICIFIVCSIKSNKIKFDIESKLKFSMKNGKSKLMNYA